jgi:hypothetical protein
VAAFALAAVFFHVMCTVDIAARCATCRAMAGWSGSACEHIGFIVGSGIVPAKSLPNGYLL